MDVEMKIAKLEEIKNTPITKRDKDEDEIINSMQMDEKTNRKNTLDTRVNLMQSSQSAREVSNNLELVWNDLTLTAIISQGLCRSNKNKIILNKLNGRVQSGECLAVLGPSKCGKTSLLNYLSNKIDPANLKVEGTYTLNGEQINSERFQKISCYVMQEDHLEATMSPKEILLFTAKMKFNLPTDEIELKVAKMITDLHLNKCQNTPIGDHSKRGVSGGERKRTSIGVELITDPKIIFLDEPSTGLDSYNTYELIVLLKKLTEKGKIVIFTIHQPSSQIFDLLDKINILALGKTIYFGPKDDCYDFFENINIPIPLSYNPFEHFMEATGTGTVEDDFTLKKFPELKSIENTNERYESYIKILNCNYEKIKLKYTDESPIIRGFSDETKNLFKLKNVDQINFFYQWSLIFARNLIVAMRNSNILYSKMVLNTLVGVQLAIIYAPVIFIL